MSYGLVPPTSPPTDPPTSPPEPHKSWPRRHKIATILLSLGSLVVVLIVVGIIGAAVGTGKTAGVHINTTPSAAAPVAATPAAPAPAAAPNPQGNYSGSCDYTLSSSLFGNDHLIGEIEENLTHAPCAVNSTVSILKYHGINHVLHGVELV